ncbi:MAG: hypothetical protein RL559_1155 [Pseudomonadota bacterium]|jgi:NitT/TauT family transport system substrate-binding protein
MDAQRRHTLATALGLVTAPGLAARAWAGEAPLVSVAVSARHSLYHLPLVLAERLGFFRQRGLQVELLWFDSGAQALASLQAGQAQVLAGAFERLFELQAQGQFHQAFVQMTRTPLVSLGVTTRWPALQSWQELRATRVGVSSLDSATHWMASLWLQHHGLSAEDVRFVPVGTSAAALGALWEGQIDVLCNTEPVMYWLEQRHDIRLIAEARTLSGTRQLMGGEVPGGCLMAPEAFLVRQPQVAQALADGVVMALRWLRTAGPTDFFKQLSPPPWIGDRAVYLGALDKLRDAYAREGLIQEQAVANALRSQARLSPRLRQQRVLASRTYTNTFASRAQARLPA